MFLLLYIYVYLKTSSVPVGKKHYKVDWLA